MRAIYLAVLALCTSGCFGASITGGYTKGLTPNAPNAVQLAADIEWIMAPETSKKLPGGGTLRLIDRTANCFWGYRAGVRGAFHKKLAMMGVTFGVVGYCRANKIIAFSTMAGIKAIEVGSFDGVALGLGSPYAEVGVRFRLIEELYLETYGLGGYDIRIGKVPSYPYVGGGLRVLAIVP